MKRNIEYYVTSSGEKPFIKWIEKLDRKTRVIVTNYVDRLADGGTTKNPLRMVSMKLKSSMAQG